METFLIRQGYSLANSEFILNAWTPRTRVTYGTYVRKYLEFCKGKKIDPFHPSFTSFLEFFVHRRKNYNESYNNFVQARGALSFISKILFADQKYQHQIALLSRALFHHCPPIPKPKDHIWDVNLVLAYLEKLPPNNKLSLLQLSKKVATLTMLATTRRQMEIRLCRLDHATFKPTSITFHLQTPVKNYSHSNFRTSAQLQQVTVPRLPGADTRLCPVKSIMHYIERTKSIRGDCQSLFILTKDPYTAVSGPTFARWVRDTLVASGVPMHLYNVHDCRKASSSASYLGGANLDFVIKQGGWSSSHVFISTYLKKIKTNQRHPPPKFNWHQSLRNNLRHKRFKPAASPSKSSTTSSVLSTIHAPTSTLVQAQKLLPSSPPPPPSPPLSPPPSPASVISIPTVDSDAETLAYGSDKEMSPIKLSRAKPEVTTTKKAIPKQKALKIQKPVIQPVFKVPENTIPPRLHQESPTLPPPPDLPIIGLLDKIGHLVVPPLDPTLAAGIIIPGKVCSLNTCHPQYSRVTVLTCLDFPPESRRKINTCLVNLASTQLLTFVLTASLDNFQQSLVRQKLTTLSGFENTLEIPSEMGNFYLILRCNGLNQLFMGLVEFKLADNFVKTFDLPIMSSHLAGQWLQIVEKAHAVSEKSYYVKEVPLSVYTVLSHVKN